MAKKTIIFWRDIPSQVVTQRGRKREKALLGHRFQEAIDRAAMRAGKGGSEAYIEEWRRETTELAADANLKAVADSEAERLEKAYSDEQLLALIRRHGSAGE